MDFTEDGQKELSRKEKDLFIIPDLDEAFYETDKPMIIAEFVRMCAGGPDTMEVIFSHLSKATDLKVGAIKAEFKPSETFSQFGERLVRAGAYPEVKR